MEFVMFFLIAFLVFAAVVGLFNFADADIF
jgi:hypothetical protein